MAATFGEALAEVEAKLDRRLDAEEIALVGRMVDAERGVEEIVEVLGAVQEPAPAEETFRYEASGGGVVRIPDVAPEEGENADVATD